MQLDVVCAESCLMYPEWAVGRLNIPWEAESGMHGENESSRIREGGRGISFFGKNSRSCVLLEPKNTWNSWRKLQQTDHKALEVLVIWILFWEGIRFWVFPNRPQAKAETKERLVRSGGGDYIAEFGMTPSLHVCLEGVTKSPQMRGYTTSNNLQAPAGPWHTH